MSKDTKSEHTRSDQASNTRMFNPQQTRHTPLCCKPRLVQFSTLGSFIQSLCSIRITTCIMIRAHTMYSKCACPHHAASPQACQDCTSHSLRCVMCAESLVQCSLCTLETSPSCCGTSSRPVYSTRCITHHSAARKAVQPNVGSQSSAEFTRTNPSIDVSNVQLHGCLSWTVPL
jgi:hypothetical protein